MNEHEALLLRDTLMAEHVRKARRLRLMHTIFRAALWLSTLALFFTFFFTRIP